VNKLFRHLKSMVRSASMVIAASLVAVTLTLVGSSAPAYAAELVTGALTSTRDSATNSYHYDLTVAVAGSSDCVSYCFVGFDYRLVGSTSDSSGPAVQVTPASDFSHEMSGSLSIGQVSQIHPYVFGNNGLTYGDWVSAGDPFPTQSISIQPQVRIDGAGDSRTLTYSVPVTASHFWGPGLTCVSSSLGCDLQLGVKYADGRDSVADQVGGIFGVSYPYTHTFSRTITIGKTDVVGIHAVIVEGRPTGTVILDSDTPDLLTTQPSETVGGSNPSTKDCGCNRTDPVDTRTGQYFENLTDLAVPGVGPAVALTRSYSTVNANADGPFGYGWSTDFTSHLTFSGGGGPPVVVEVAQENGSTVSFTTSSGGAMVAPPRVLATLTMNTAGNWVFVRRKAQTFTYDPSGNLISLADVHGNTVSYARNGAGKVSSITGSGGREIDLTWAGSHVTGVEDSAGRSVDYSYNSSGELTAVNDVTGGTSSYGYDTSHLMTTVTMPDGGTTTNAYDSSGRVVSQTDPVGRESTFAYSDFSTVTTFPDGSQTRDTYLGSALASSTSALGTAHEATTSITYDIAGNQLKVTDPLGHTTSSTYDSAGNALTTTDPLGKVTTRTYDSLNDVLTVEDPLGRTSTMTYNGAGDLTSVQTPGGHTTTLSLNTDGTIETSTDARDKTTSYSYDSAGRPLCVTDPDSRQTCQAYDSRGLATSKTDAAGKVTHLTYDDAGRVLTVEDPDSHTTTYMYDGDGNLSSTQDPSGHTVTATYDDADQRVTSTDGRGKTTSYTYTTRGSLATATDPNSHVTTNTYDAQNQLTSVTDPDSHVTSYAYDLAGHKISTTMPSTAVTSSTFDDDGRVATTTDALGKVTTYAYDDAGQLHSVTDPLSRVTTYGYTDDGKLHVTTLPDSSTETYTYNADDVQTSFENADGQTASYSYDDAGMLTSETQPGSMTTSYGYDTAGRIHTVTTPDGVVGTRSYDDAGRLTGVNYPGTADDVSYAYFADGTRHTMTDGTGTTTYAYNANSALTSVQNGDGQTIGYGYDNASQLTSITYPGSKTVTYGYDNAGNMSSVTDWASRTTTLTVTADGLQNTRTDPSGVTETRSYNASDQLTDISSATSSATLSDYGYGYDNAGQLTSSTLTDAIHTTAATNAWGYTNLGQLSSIGPSTGYATTPAGELTATPAGDAFSYNSKQQLASATNTGAGTSSTYGYDDNGSRTATATTVSATTTTVSYGYDARGDLISVTTGGTTVTYQSDGDGLRQSRTVGTTTSPFLWDPNHAISVLLDDGTDSYIYATGTTPIAQIDDTTGMIEYLHTDNVGSVRTITSATGTVIGTTDFTPYGQVSSHTGTSASAFGYATAWADPTTGLDYLRAREYDPQTAQFLQVDPALDQTHQPYEYVAGDPNNADDPTGQVLIPPLPNIPAEILGFGSSEEGSAVWSFLNQTSPTDTHYGPGSAFVDDMQGTTEYQKAICETVANLRAGDTKTIVDASYDSYPSPFAALGNLVRDGFTAARWNESSAGDQAHASLGSYTLLGSVTSVNPKTRTATVTFKGSNTYSAGSLTPIPNNFVRTVVNIGAYGLGVLRPVHQTFTFTTKVGY
jgi:RHS repeat-associated protein